MLNIFLSGCHSVAHPHSIYLTIPNTKVFKKTQKCSKDSDKSSITELPNSNATEHPSLTATWVETTTFLMSYILDHPTGVSQTSR